MALFLPVIVAQAHLSYQRSLAFPEPQVIAYRDIGTWLNRHTASDATVAAWEIGAIGYHSDPASARLPRPHHPRGPPRRRPQ